MIQALKSTQQHFVLKKHDFVFGSRKLKLNDHWVVKECYRFKCLLKKIKLFFVNTKKKNFVWNGRMFHIEYISKLLKMFYLGYKIPKEDIELDVGFAKSRVLLSVLRMLLLPCNHLHTRWLKSLEREVLTFLLLWVNTPMYVLYPALTW